MFRTAKMFMNGESYSGGGHGVEKEVLPPTGRQLSDKSDKVQMWDIYNRV